MTKSAYDRWLAFISGPTRGRYGLTFPTAEAKAIMAIPPWPERDWRRDKREINKAARRARLSQQFTNKEG